VVNKIAAGEVVERPSAVVKELVENAVDAGADRVDIFIEKAGVKLIKVVDNGCGIGEDQIEIAFARHATSKITQFKDLDSLYSYGFRGEALPSIASVSRLRMVSRPADADSGTELIIEGGVVQNRAPIAAPPGTSIEVESLFFNTPARRKFLKAESTEARYLSRTATALALGQPEIGFSYTVNGREVFSVPSSQSLVERARVLLGAGDGRMVAVEGEEGPVQVHGCVGPPDIAQHNRFGLYLFVNSRYIYSPVLSHAVRAAYGEMLPSGLYPVGALLVTLDPAAVDVNVHPSKTEVRLSHEREVHDAVRRIVAQSLRQDGVIPEYRHGSHRPASTGAGGERPSVSPPSAGEPTIPGIYSRESGRELLSELQHIRPRDTNSEPTPPVVKVDTRTGEILDDQVASRPGPAPAPAEPQPDVSGPSEGFQLIGRFSDRYLLLQSGDNLYVVDQHTAHERVLYEEMLRRFDNSSVESQTLLLPVQIELTPEQMSVFAEVSDELNRGGFTVSEFGGRMVNVEAVPVVMAKRSPQKVVMSVLDDLSAFRRKGQDLTKGMAQSMACRAAVMAGDRLSEAEATHLIERLLQCSDKYTCPHGRPTFIRITRHDLDKQFGRE
jgi:DNA mismatch repair protein MutL